VTENVIEGDSHEHPMLLELTGFRTDDLGEALHITRSILLPS